MGLVTILGALPAAGASPSGMLANSTGLVRLTISLSSSDEQGQWQLCQKNADSGQWSFVNDPNAILTVGQDGGLVGQLLYQDPDGGANFQVVQVSPQIPEGGSVNGAAGYLTAATPVSGPTMGASTVSTLTATGAITAQSTLSVAGALTASAALSVGTTSTFTGIATFNAAPVIAAGLTASGAVANNFSGSTGTFLTSSGANTLSGTTTVAANKNLLCAAGTTALDFSLGTGIFATPTGAGTLSGTTNIAANKNLTCSAGTTSLDLSLGTGATLTTTGLNTIGGDLLMASGKIVGFGAPQALSGAGAVDVVSLATLFTSTGGAQALTLADGTRAGQIKFIMHVVDGGSGVLTPTTKTNFTTVTFTNVYDWAALMWSGSAWRPLAYSGAVFA